MILIGLVCASAGFSTADNISASPGPGAFRVGGLVARIAAPASPALLEARADLVANWELLGAGPLRVNFGLDLDKGRSSLEADLRAGSAVA